MFSISSNIYAVIASNNNNTNNNKCSMSKALLNENHIIQFSFNLMKPRSPALQADSLPSEPPGTPQLEIIKLSI